MSDIVGCGGYGSGLGLIASRSVRPSTPIYLVTGWTDPPPPFRSCLLRRGEGWGHEVDQMPISGLLNTVIQVMMEW